MAKKKWEEKIKEKKNVAEKKEGNVRQGIWTQKFMNTLKGRLSVYDRNARLHLCILLHAGTSRS